MISIPFNPERHYLGNLCALKHDYQDTGRSIRVKGNRDCVICTYIRRKKWEEENAEKNKKRSRENYLRKDYGISTDEYANLLKIQNGVCAICKCPPKGERPLCIDHNHNNGEIRGLLCDGCNLGIGFFEEDIERLKLAVVYLERVNKP